MALYTVSNGGTVQSADVNQYYNLLTGATTDQPVTIANRIKATNTGASTASGYMGGVTGAAPASGTFALGDLVIDQKGPLWVCTTAGTPGTWSSTPTRIATNTLSGTAASVTFSSIPSTFTTLKLLWRGRSDNAITNVTVSVRVNSDSGNNYIWQQGESSASAISGSNSGGATSSLKVGNASGSTATANYFGSGTCWFNGWNQSTAFLQIFGEAVCPTSATNIFLGMYGGEYVVATTYSSITILPGAGNFIAGSSFTLYGYN